jgi:hypothetical protein
MERFLPLVLSFLHPNGMWLVEQVTIHNNIVYILLQLNKMEMSKNNSIYSEDWENENSPYYL